jgi:hypothetical protein
MSTVDLVSVPEGSADPTNAIVKECTASQIVNTGKFLADLSIFI